MDCKRFTRSDEQNKLLGIYEAEQEQIDPDSFAKDEVLQFNTNCPNCNSPCFTNMKVTSKQCLIFMSNLLIIIVIYN